MKGRGRRKTASPAGEKVANGAACWAAQPRLQIGMSRGGKGPWVGKEDGERRSRGRNGDGFILDVGGVPRKRQGVKRGALPEEATSISWCGFTNSNITTLSMYVLVKMRSILEVSATSGGVFRFFGRIRNWLLSIFSLHSLLKALRWKWNSGIWKAHHAAGHCLI